MADTNTYSYLDALSPAEREREEMLEERSRRLYPGFPGRLQRKQDMADADARREAAHAKR